MPDFTHGKGGQAVLTLMNFCGLDRGGETLRESFGLFLELCKGPGIALPRGAPVLSAGMGSPRSAGAEALWGCPECRRDALEGGGSESCPRHYLQSH